MKAKKLIPIALAIVCLCALSAFTVSAASVETPDADRETVIEETKPEVTTGETVTVLEDGLKNGLQNGLKNGAKNGLVNGTTGGLKNGLKNGAKNGLVNGATGGLKNGLKNGMKNGLVNGEKK